jgi:asparagine synthase (glutamine-hydrolysing)
LLKLGLSDCGAAAAFDQLPSDPAIWLAVHQDLRVLAPEAGRAIWRRWASSRGESLTTRQQRVDYGMFLTDDVLVKVDRASMAHSIEVRSPFLDYRLVEWAAGLPRSALLNAREGKLPLRALAGRLLPTVVERGVKRGFGVPLDDWFRQPAGQAFARERLLSSEARRLGFWDSKGVERVIKLHQSPRSRGFGLLLWRSLMLEAWARHYSAGTVVQ